MSIWPQLVHREVMNPCKLYLFILFFFYRAPVLYFILYIHRLKFTLYNNKNKVLLVSHSFISVRNPWFIYQTERQAIRSSQKPRIKCLSNNFYTLSHYILTVTHIPNKLHSLHCLQQRFPLCTHTHTQTHLFCYDHSDTLLTPIPTHVNKHSHIYNFSTLK